MTLNLSVPGQTDLKPRITVFGVGGAGGNAVNNMIEKELDGVDFVVANTDAQALQQSRADLRIQLGVKVTEGLGAGARATVGAAAAEESIEQIVDHLAGAHMCFITAGMGGGTGTGAAPIIAQAARELGVLTVGVVTKPFQFEGGKRMRQAEEGVEALQKVVDTLIIIPNQNLFRLANEKTTFTEAFSLADDVLYQGVKGVTDLMVRPGLINLDFADVRAVMDEMGKAMMGTGEADGEDRAIQAAEKAIANPLLDEISLRGARGVLINITGGNDLTLFELDEAANRIRDEVDPEANIIVGSTLDVNMGGQMRVSVVATGIDASEVVQEIPVPRRRLSEPLSQQTIEAPAAPVLVAVEDVVAQDSAPVHEISEDYEEVSFEREEPSLFGEINAENAAAEDEMEDIFAEDTSDDGLPAPAYRPAVNEFRADEAPAQQYQSDYHADQHAAPAEPSIESFVAPRGPRTGEPSPETLARLQAAVNKMPRSGGDSQSTEGRGRIGGIGSLINRMTGSGDSQAAVDPRPSERQQPFMRAQEPRAESDSAADPDQERIEIPAFLRRQAN